MEHRQPFPFEFYGKLQLMWYSVSVYASSDGITVYWQDITDRKRAELERDANVRLLRLINQVATTAELAKAALVFFREATGCLAVGIRLKEGEDYPYYATVGFKPEFVQAANTLLGHEADGTLHRDSEGKPCIECLCGEVLCARTSRGLPVFTAGGSFWTNSTTEFLTLTPEANRMTRNVCNAAGYESLALVPLRTGDQTLGLLHFADERKGLFSDEKIVLWERLAVHLATALAKTRAEDGRKRAEEALRENEAMLARAQHMANLGSWEWNMETGEVSWSKEMDRILGFEPGEIKPSWLVVAELLRPASPEQLKASLEQAVAERRTWDAEVELTRRDGSWVVVQNRAEASYGPDGQARIVTGTSLDITRRKLAEKALRRSNEDLAHSNEDLVRFNRVAVGRELRMIELKKEANELLARAGQAARYPLAFEKETR